MPFQSTPPARGATVIGSIYRAAHHISIHAPREGGDELSLNKVSTPPIFQSTPPARGATRECIPCGKTKKYFNPRPPRGGRRQWHNSEVVRQGISIHAPREGGDDYRAWVWEYLTISIHAPREGGDPDLRQQQHPCAISIHAPREGGDSPARPESATLWNFNPRPPRGGRL